jgi:predicted transcriptional regulator
VITQLVERSTRLALPAELRLARGVRERRERLGRSQAVLAREIGSSQSRVAKMEAADPTVSIDLLVRTLLAFGAGPRDLARPGA